MNNVKLPVGISDFHKLRQNEYYYVDKTNLIKELLESRIAEVTLITRPRRFGKTIGMSMLAYFFDIRKDSRKLFEDLKISRDIELCQRWMNQYPTLFISFKDVDGLNFQSAMKMLRNQISWICNEHDYLSDSDKVNENDKKIFLKLQDISEENLSEDLIKISVATIIRMMNAHYGKPVILLLDEYDVPLQTAYVEGYYEEAVKFFKTFYGTTFKDNQYLQKTVLTGVSRVAKESIFSGANNFDVYTVLDDEFSDDFGITEKEMDKIIEDFEVQDEKEEIKKWYDGYIIGHTEGIYNPWSILNYLTDRKLMPYWVNTSSNDLIKLILKNSATVKEKIEQLLRDEEIEVPINLETVIVGIEQNEENIWGLLLGTGYLKVTGVVDLAMGVYKVKIPNYEIKFLFQNIIRDWFNDKVIGNNLNTILKDLVTLKLDEFEQKFKVLVRQMFSFMDVGENTAENFYHAFVLGMLVGLKDNYYVKSNRESGYGRYDIMLEPKDKNGNSFIMEFKVYREEKEKDINDTIESAKKQIEERKYEENLQEKGFTNITKMVFAFKGKEVKMQVV